MEKTNFFHCIRRFAMFCKMTKEIVFVEQKQFLSSYRFNKTTPAEFGLIGQDDRTYLCPKDNSLWVQMDLYDFGWGREYGFCKIPMLDFEQLFDLLIHAQLEENGVYRIQRSGLPFHYLRKNLIRDSAHQRRRTCTP